MKYISFSLWGDKPIYNVGVLKNAQLCKTLYSDWKMVVFYDNTVPENTISELQKLDVLTVDVSEKNIYGMFWRFFAVDLPDCEYAIFRDADSRISLREKLAVDEWVKSGKTLHVMRDHPNHKIPHGNDEMGILGGMWGIKSKIIPLTEWIGNYEFKSENKYGGDQAFLKKVFNFLKNDMVEHDDFFSKNPFPIKRENGRFIGERISEFDQPVNWDFMAVLNR